MKLRELKILACACVANMGVGGTWAFACVVTWGRRTWVSEIKGRSKQTSSNKMMGMTLALNMVTMVCTEIGYIQ